MANPPNTAAREYLTASEKSLLEQYGVTADEFERAARPEQAPPQRDTDAERPTGSTMVKDDRPAPEPRPPKELAQDVDRQAFERKWADELQRAQERGPEQTNAPEPDREYDR